MKPHQVSGFSLNYQLSIINCQLSKSQQRSNFLDECRRERREGSKVRGRCDGPREAAERNDVPRLGVVEKRMRGKLFL